MEYTYNTTRTSTTYKQKFTYFKTRNGLLISIDRKLSVGVAIVEITPEFNAKLGAEELEILKLSAQPFYYAEQLVAGKDVTFHCDDYRVKEIVLRHDPSFAW